MFIFKINVKRIKFFTKNITIFDNISIVIFNKLIKNYILIVNFESTTIFFDFDIEKFEFFAKNHYAFLFIQRTKIQIHNKTKKISKIII